MGYRKDGEQSECVLGSKINVHSENGYKSNLPADSKRSFWEEHPHDLSLKGIDTAHIIHVKNYSSDLRLKKNAESIFKEFKNIMEVEIKK